MLSTNKHDYKQSYKLQTLTNTNNTLSTVTGVTELT